MHKSPPCISTGGLKNGRDLNVWALTPLLGGLYASLLSIVEPISSTTDGPGAQPLANLGAYGGTYPRQSSLKENKCEPLQVHGIVKIVKNHQENYLPNVKLSSNHKQIQFRFSRPYTDLYLDMVHASPRDIQSSISFEVRQLSSRSFASLVNNGATTLEARSGVPFRGSRHASTSKHRMVHIKWMSSGAFGSCMWGFNLACKKLQTSEKINILQET